MLRPRLFLFRLAGFAALLPVLAASGAVAQEPRGSGAGAPSAHFAVLAGAGQQLQVQLR
jgi:hypothetical protein